MLSPQDWKFSVILVGNYNVPLLSTCSEKLTTPEGTNFLHLRCKDVNAEHGYYLEVNAIESSGDSFARL